MFEEPVVFSNAESVREGETAPSPLSRESNRRARAALSLSVASRRGRASGKRPVIWGALGVVAVLIAGLVGFVLGLRPQPGHIVPGARVWQAAVGDMTPDAARGAVEASVAPLLAQPIVLADGSRLWRLAPGEMGFSYDIEAAVDEALAIGRRGNVLTRAREGWQARRRGVEVRLRRRMDRAALAGRLGRIAEAGRIRARDARVRYEGGVFHISAEQVGRIVDAEATEKNIVRYFDPRSHRSVALVARDDVPRLLAADLRAVEAPLKSFSTRFDPRDVNRTHNLSLASRSLDGSVVLPGEVFSFNHTVGPRLEKLGYRPAIIFSRGEMLEGVGGGVCQVATTVYNAARDSRLPIVERVRHSRPVTYVPPGRDAAVSFGLVDLKFRNPTSAPILIHSQMTNDTLTVTLYGSRRFRERLAQSAAGTASRRTSQDRSRDAVSRLQTY